MEEKVYDIFPKADSSDEFILKNYKNGKEYPFKRNVGLISKVQQMTALGRINFIKSLKEEGVTRDDLVTRVDNGDGTVSYDESTFRYLETKHIKEYRALKTLELMDQCFEGDITFTKVLIDLGVASDEVKSQLVGKKLGLILFGGAESEDNTFPTNAENLRTEEQTTEEINI